LKTDSSMKDYDINQTENQAQKSHNSDVIEEVAEVMDELFDVARWEQSVSDWVSSSTGELVSGYTAGDGMKELVTKKIIVRSNYNPN